MHSSSLMAITTLAPQWLSVIKEEVNSNEKLQRIVEQVCTNKDQSSPWKFVEGVIYFKDKIYIAEGSSLILLLLNEFQRSTHGGFRKNSSQAASRFLLERYEQWSQRFFFNLATFARHTSLLLLHRPDYCNHCQFLIIFAVTLPWTSLLDCHYLRLKLFYLW